MAMYLTGIPEIDQQVLIRLPIDDLQSYCLTNPDVGVCNDPTFWKEKLKWDGLIDFTYWADPKSLTEWVDLYHRTFTAIARTKELLYILAIESTRQDDQLNRVTLTINRLFSEFLYDLDVLSENEIYLIDDGFKTGKHVALYLTYVNEDEFDILIEILNLNTGLAETIEIKLNYSDVYHLFIKLFFIHPRLQVLDDHAAPYFIHEDADVSEYHPNSMRILMKRMGIRESFKRNY